MEKLVRVVEGPVIIIVRACLTPIIAAVPHSIKASTFRHCTLRLIKPPATGIKLKPEAGDFFLQLFDDCPGLSAGSIKAPTFQSSICRHPAMCIVSCRAACPVCLARIL